VLEPARGQETVDAGASEREDAAVREGMPDDEPRIDPPHVKKNQCKPWLRKMWCVGKITVVYRDRMYDLLGLYAEEYDPKKPVICTDEKSKQLLENKKAPIPMRSGRNERYDYEYKRNGTRNIFVAVEPQGGWRKASVTKHRKKPDFARCIRDLLQGAALPQCREDPISAGQPQHALRGLILRDVPEEGSGAHPE